MTSAHADIPSSNDLYSIPREGMFTNAKTAEQKEWLLLNIQKQATGSMKHLLAPEMKRSLRKQIADQLLMDVSNGAPMDELNNYLNTIIALGIPDAVVSFAELVKNPVIKNRNLKDKLRRLLKKYR